VKRNTVRSAHLAEEACGAVENRREAVLSLCIRTPINANQSGRPCDQVASHVSIRQVSPGVTLSDAQDVTARVCCGGSVSTTAQPL
jgi:hypothetical protein